MGQKKEESSRQFWKEPSRASGSSFFQRYVCVASGPRGVRESERICVLRIDDGFVSQRSSAGHTLPSIGRETRSERDRRADASLSKAVQGCGGMRAWARVRVRAKAKVRVRVRVRTRTSSHRSCRRPTPGTRGRFADTQDPGTLHAQQTASANNPSSWSRAATSERAFTGWKRSMAHG